MKLLTYLLKSKLHQNTESEMRSKNKFTPIRSLSRYKINKENNLSLVNLGDKFETHKSYSHEAGPLSKTLILINLMRATKSNQIHIKPSTRYIVWKSKEEVQ